ncbi:MAG TPA: hypothetical protein DHO02_02750 [Syntrophaceae bacterium]|nr:hypothetical protein [Syntrophaceae bacterium]HCS77687.1 hypothetical protein [Syntrophaceae bacterium]HCX01329.1 hypothetical protein [Syntrophaceae bacterium]
MNLEVGTLLRWNHFPWPRYGTEIKPRWFIYLGDNGPFAQIAFVYLATTTTQIEHFKSGGARNGHNHFKFETRQFASFDNDCIIDYDDPPYAIKKQYLLNHQADLEVKGKLNEQTLRMIYNNLLKSDACSKMVLLDLHSSFNNAGITSLKKPK